MNDNPYQSPAGPQQPQSELPKNKNVAWLFSGFVLMTLSLGLVFWAYRLKMTPEQLFERMRDGTIGPADYSPGLSFQICILAASCVGLFSFLTFACYFIIPKRDIAQTFDPE